jgi:hypothetical protein
MTHEDICINFESDGDGGTHGHGATAPRPRARRRLSLYWFLAVFFWAAFLFTVCFVCFRSEAAVFVQGEGWSMTDDGTITVSGVGGYEPGQTIIITNVVGRCTNCTALAVDDVHRMGRSLRGDVSSLRYYLVDITNSCSYISSKIAARLDEISGFRDLDGDILTSTGYNVSAARFSVLSNWLETALLSGSVQAELAESRYPDWRKFGSSSVGRSGFATYIQGIYEYAEFSEKPFITDLNSKVTSINSNALQSFSVVDSVEQVSERLLAAEICDDGFGDVPPSESITIPVYTNTLYVSGVGAEQFGVLTQIVAHIDRDCHGFHVQLNAISNNVYSLDKRMAEYADEFSRVFYNGFQGFPRDIDALQVYYHATNNVFGYDSSNVMQRVELLLLSLATNNGTNGVFDAGDDLEPVDVADTLVGSTTLTTDFSEMNQRAESLGDSIIGFFRSLSSIDESPMQDGDIFVNEMSVSFGNDQSYTLPAVRNSGVGTGVFNALCTTTRYFVMFITSLISLWIVYGFWVRFAYYAVEFSKWVLDLISSIFA